MVNTILEATDIHTLPGYQETREMYRFAREVEAAVLAKLREQKAYVGGDDRTHVICLCPDCSAPLSASAQTPRDERATFEAWWKGDLVDWRGHQNTAALHAWDGWQARATLAAPLPTVVQVPQVALRPADNREFFTDPSKSTVLEFADPEAPANGPSGADRKAALIQIGQAALKAGWREGELADFVAAKLAAPEAPAQANHWREQYEWAFNGWEDCKRTCDALRDQQVPAPWREAVKVARRTLNTARSVLIGADGYSSGSYLVKDIDAALAQLDALEGGE